MPTLYERLSSTSRGSAALSSARLRRAALGAIHRGMTLAGVSQAELARSLGLRRSAVNQVVRGDGNLRLETLAEYLHAMGLEADIRLAEVGELRAASVQLREPRYLVRRRGDESPSRPSFVSVFTTMAVTEQGVGPASFVAMSETDPVGFLAQPELRMTISLKDGAVRRPARPRRSDDRAVAAHQTAQLGAEQRG